MNFLDPTREQSEESVGTPTRYLPGLAEPRSGPDFSGVLRVFLKPLETMSTVYLNGDYLPKDRATISVDDRGFLLSDGLYEVTPAYRGRLFRIKQHMRRLQNGLDALRIVYDPKGLPEVHSRLIAANALDAEDVAIVYVQITRGVAQRTHHFPPEGTPPTVYAFAQVYHRPESARWERGYEAITVPDHRWARVDIKSIGLLPNVLAQQAAVDAGGGGRSFGEGRRRARGVPQQRLRSPRWSGDDAPCHTADPARYRS